MVATTASTTTTTITTTEDGDGTRHPELTVVDKLDLQSVDTLRRSSDNLVMRTCSQYVHA